MTIVVTGATGHLGHLVVEALLDRGADPAGVIATGRDLEKAADLRNRGVRTVAADYTDPGSLRAAFAGADRVLLVSGSEIGRRIAQHRNVIEAAGDAGADLVAYTSISHADTAQLQLATEHRATEELLRGSGLDWVSLRNSWYLENYLSQVPVYLEHGVVLGAAEEGRVSAALRSDFADAAAAVLLDADTPRNTVHELGGTPFGFAELADAVGAAAGRTVSYQSLSEEDLIHALVAAGLPEPYAAVLADSDRGIARGELEVSPDVLAGLIGRPPTSMREAVAATVSDLADGPGA